MAYSGSQPDFTRRSSAPGSKQKKTNYKPVIVVLTLIIIALIVVLIVTGAKKKKGPDDTVIIDRTDFPSDRSTPDHGGNVSSADPVLIPTHEPSAPVTELVFVEAGQELPAASAFLKEGYEHSFAYYLSNTSNIDTRVCGTYPVELQCGDKTYGAVIIVRDTVAPSAQTRSLFVQKGSAVKPEDFIVSINDGTDVTAEFTQSVDTETKGTRQVEILLKDAAGNSTVVTAEITVDVDDVPPVIEAIAYREIFVGDTISYRQGLSATDDRGGEVKISIDSSAVNLKEPGSYKVIYTATDEAGNTSTFEATVVVRDLSELETDEGKYSVAALHRKFSNLLPKVIKDDMSDIEKLYAIWTYVSEHIEYISHSDKDSWVREAIRGLDEGVGDCFTYYAAMRAFMEEAGFETVPVHRLGGDTQHFWSLVKVGGEWYHIDACPRAEKRYRYWYCFLRTDEELRNFGKKGTNGFDDYECNYYYQFDTSLYPASGTEKLADALVNWDTGDIYLKIY